MNTQNMGHSYKPLLLSCSSFDNYPLFVFYMLELVIKYLIIVTQRKGHHNFGLERALFTHISNDSPTDILYDGSPIAAVITRRDPACASLRALALKR